jgi:hypothetical protein
MPKQMSKPEMLRFITICEDQGIKVTRTKKGLLLRFPDGTSTVQHFTNSDTRATPNQIARFRRAGMVHPNDTRQQSESLPTYITSGTISPKTRQKIIDYVASQGFPESVLSSRIVKDLNMDPGWANRALYHSGFRPGKAKSRKVGRPWYTPEEILCLRPDLKAEEEAAAIVDDADAKAIEALEPITTGEAISEHREQMEDDGIQEPSTPEPVVADEPQVEDIQFIDVRDSWVVGHRELLGEHLARMVEDRLDTLKAVGIDWEIRVWRR